MRRQSRYLLKVFAVCSFCIWRIQRLLRTVRVNRATKSLQRLVPLISKWLKRQRSSRLQKVLTCLEGRIAQTLLHTLVTRWRDAIIRIQRATREFLTRLHESTREIVAIWERKDTKKHVSKPLKCLLTEIYRRYQRRISRHQTTELQSNFNSHVSELLLRKKTALEVIHTRTTSPQLGTALLTKNFYKLSERQVEGMIKKCKVWLEHRDLEELIEEEIEELERELGIDTKSRSITETGRTGKGRKGRKTKHWVRNCPD